jgi:uncharacterized protein (TIGR02594 family)
VADFDLSLAITAEAGQAAAELERVTKGVDQMTAAEFRAAGGADGLGKAHEKAQREAKAKADVMDRLARATDNSTGSLRLIEQTLGRATSQFMAGKLSAADYAKAQDLARQASARLKTQVDATNISAGQMRASMNNLNYQIQDVAMGLSMGIDPFRVLAQQGGQVAMAMQGMGGAITKVGNFMAGPFGTAIIVATTLLGGLWLASRKAEEQLNDTGKAADFKRMKIDELRQAIKDQNEALEKAVLTGREAEQQTLDGAKAARDAALAIREETRDTLRLAEARLLAAETRPRGTGTDAASEAGGAISEVLSIRSRLAAAEKALADAEGGVGLARIPQLRREADARTDKRKAITQRYEQAEEAARRVLEQQIAQGRKRENAEAQYVAALEAAARQRQREEEQLREENRRPRRTRDPNLGTVVETALGEDILAAAQRYSGQHERTNKGSLMGLFREAGINIDPQMIAWCAAFVNAVLATQGVQGTGKLNARSFLGWGSETNDPRKGDIVVARRGNNPAEGHVGIFQGRDARGNIQVLGGNTSDRVGIQTIAPRDILGFRRAPSAADSYREQERIAEQEARRADQLATWGEGARHRIGQTATRWEQQPNLIRQSQLALADLNRLMDEISEKRPPDWEDLIDQAMLAGNAIRDGIHRPYLDMLESMQSEAEQRRLILEGRRDEAEALRMLAPLQKAVGTEAAQVYLPVLLAAVQARNADEAALARIRDRQAELLAVTKSVAGAFRGIFQADISGLLDLPKRLFSAFEQAFGDFLFDQIFGETFRQLEDQIKGSSVVEDASNRMQTAIDAAAASIAKLGDAAEAAAGGIPGTTQQDAATAARVDIAANVPRDPRQMFARIFERLAEGVLGREAAERFGRVMVKGLEGAGIGRLVASVTGGNKTGGAVGGAIGGILGESLGKAVGPALGKAIGGSLGKTLGAAGGPIGSVLGSIAGSVAGSMIGGLFAPSRRGSTTISNATDALGYSGTSRSQSAVTGAGASVQNTLSRIAEALGADLGAFRVSIGTDKKGRYVVDPTGSGRTKKGGGTMNFGDDQGAAVAAAIADAIADGALANLSAAVQRAVRKYGADLDRGLREALKVQEVETLIGGLGDQLQRVFADFERQASERVRIAREYGFNLVELERINAEQRAKLFNDTLESRIGDLRRLLDDLNFGDLFEGTLMDQRTALIGQIADARTKAEGGDLDAIRRVADLERQLIETSRNAFGTAGPEYAADITAARQNAERLIELETQRAREAQERATAHLNAANQQVQLQNETNNLLALINANISALGGGGVGAGSGFGGGESMLGYETARNVSLL